MFFLLLAASMLSYISPCLKGSFIPAALISLAILSIYLLKLENSAGFQDDIVYCLASSGYCETDDARHFYLEWATGDSICMENGDPCISPKIDMNEFESSTLDSEELRRVAEAMIEQDKYFPYIVSIMVLCLISLVLFTVSCKCVKLTGSFGDNDRRALQVIDMLFCATTGSACIAAGLDYTAFNLMDCNDADNYSICKEIQYHNFKINSLNESDDIASEYFPIFMYCYGSSLLFGTVVWGIYINATMPVAVTPDEIIFKDVYTTSECAHVLLKDIQIYCDKNMRVPFEQTCAICLDETTAASPTTARLDLGGGKSSSHIAAREKGRPSIITCNCGHTFHYDCLHGWIVAKWEVEESMLESASCPTCRCLLFRGSEKDIEKREGNDLSRSIATSRASSIESTAEIMGEVS